jgi:hypothetical protein
MVLPDEVEHVLHRYLMWVDNVLPGLVEGLYLIGSTALSDYQPGVSDVDFIAVSSLRSTRTPRVHWHRSTPMWGPTPGCRPWRGRM